MAEPNKKIDLTTIAAVINWLTSVNKQTNYSEGEMTNLQSVITAASFEWLRKTGLRLGGEKKDTSPLVEVVSFNEWYDGTGTDRLFVANPPAKTVSSLTINGITIPQSAAFGQAGFVIDGDGKSLALRNGGGMVPGQRLTVGFQTRLGRGYCFTAGVQNVNLVSTCGYDGVPFDVELACRQMVAETYRSRGWIGQKSQGMGGNAGTTSYRDWAIAPNVEAVMQLYKRVALVRA